MEPRKIAISARIDHELIDYLRMNKIPVNTAINTALHYFVRVCQRDETAFSAAVHKTVSDYTLMRYATNECRKLNLKYCPHERPIIREIVDAFNVEK